MIFLAAIGAGGVFAGTNPGYTQFELAHHIKTGKVSFLISEPEILDNLAAAARDNNIPASNIWIFNTQDRPLPPGHKSWTELLKHGEEDWVRFDDPETCQNTTAARLFSSGTTGLPKAAVISHQNLIGQHTVVNETRSVDYQVRYYLHTCCNGWKQIPQWKELIIDKAYICISNNLYRFPVSSQFHVSMPQPCHQLTSALLKPAICCMSCVASSCYHSWKQPINTTSLTSVLSPPWLLLS